MIVWEIVMNAGQNFKLTIRPLPGLRLGSNNERLPGLKAIKVTGKSNIIPRLAARTLPLAICPSLAPSDRDSESRTAPGRGRP